MPNANVLSAVRVSAAARTGAATVIALLSTAAVASESAEKWLERMAQSVEMTNYRGTVLRSHSGKGEALRVVHKYENGEVHEKVEALDGAGRTIIRDRRGVRCLFPESRAVLIEQSSADSSLFSRIPISIPRLSRQYDIVLVRNNVRFTGRSAVVIAVRPHDEYRYGHRVWLDRVSALPLQTELLDEVGHVIEAIRFSDITIEESIPASEFEFAIDTRGFTLIGQPVEAGESRADVRDESWTASQLPDGFELSEALTGSGGVRHLVFDDGMASVSVFIEPPGYDAEPLNGPSSLGAANAFSVWKNDRQITAVGEVPLRTVRAIANSVRLTGTVD